MSLLGLGAEEKCTPFLGLLEIGHKEPMKIYESGTTVGAA
jgi:hypothetical protein